MHRPLPSEGKGHTFESCRVRHFRQLKDISFTSAHARDSAIVRMVPSALRRRRPLTVRTISQ
jgi:hypothetical protein